jgi:hypothetical protein
MEPTGTASKRLSDAKRRFKRATTEFKKAAAAYGDDPLSPDRAKLMEKKRKLLVDARKELERAKDAITATSIPGAKRRQPQSAADEDAAPRAFEIRTPGGPPRREQTLGVLDAIMVPLSARVISQIGAVHFGFELPVKQLSSIRRDDRRRIFDRDHYARPAYVAPAITARSLTPIPRLFTSSAWPPDRRLVGARSARADQLRCLLALLKLREAHDEPSRLDAIIRRYAINVPRAVAPGAHLEPDRIASAAEAELAQISPLDDEERAEAAMRFERLTLAEQIWGIEGATATRGLRAVGGEEP